MRLVRRVTLGAVIAIPAVAVVGLLSWAVALPARHTVSSRRVVDAPVERVFEEVTQGRTAGRWGAVPEGLEATAVEGASRHAQEIASATPPTQFVTRFLPESGLEGTSTWTFRPVTNGDAPATEVVVVHDAAVTHPLVRGLTSLTRQEATDLDAQLGALEQAVVAGDPP